MKKYIAYFLIVFFTAIVLTDCKKTNVPKGTPRCIINKIKEDKENCLDKVYEYTYNGESVYFFSYPCPEGCFVLVDSDCNIIKDSQGNSVCSCNWGGAFCSQDFWTNKTNEKLIWQKE